MKAQERAARTKKRIESALAALLAQKSIQKVHVCELCRLAGINRSTFYKHYGCPEDVLREMQDALLAMIASCIDAADTADRDSVHAQIARVFTLLLEQRDMSVLLMDENVDAGFAERLFSLTGVRELLDAAPSASDEAHRRKQTEIFIIHGAYRLIRDWLQSTDPADPMEEAEFVLMLAGRAAGHLLG